MASTNAAPQSEEEKQTEDNQRAKEKIFDSSKNSKQFNWGWKPDPGLKSEDTKEKESDLNDINPLFWGIPPATAIGTRWFVFKPEFDVSNVLLNIFYYQHICDNVNFSSKSPEELRFEDQFGKCATEAQPCVSFANSDNTDNGNDNVKSARDEVFDPFKGLRQLKWSWDPDLKNEDKKEKEPNLNDINPFLWSIAAGTAIGTKGFVFKPACDMNKKNKKFYYQHICANYSLGWKGLQKSPEELRFEDQFGKPATEAQPKWGYNTKPSVSFTEPGNTGKPSNDAWKWPFQPNKLRKWPVVEQNENESQTSIDKYLIDQVSSKCFVSTEIAQKALVDSKWDAKIAMNKINSLKLLGCDLSMFVGDNAKQNQNELTKLKDQIQLLCDKIDNLKCDNDEQQSVKASDMLCCRGIPHFLGEEQVRELLETYGELRTFCLAKDQTTGQPMGHCWFQYKDASITECAILALNKIIIGDKALVVTKSNQE